MAKKTEDTAGAESIPRNFEIIPDISPVKTVRERDRRVQMASSLSVVLACSLFVSVGCLVYQAITQGEYIHIAQDIRSGSFTELQPVPDEKRLTKAKIGSFPNYNEEADIKRLAAELEERQRLKSMLEPKAASAPQSSASDATASPGAASPASQAASAAQPGAALAQPQITQ